MSIIDEVLIYIDDSLCSKDDLETYFASQKTSVLFSAVGRLRAKKLIVKNGKGEYSHYTTTQKGSSLIKQSLSSLRDIADAVDQTWILISITISEKYKVEREKVRSFLKENGFGKIRNGLYLGTISRLESFNTTFALLCNHTDYIIFTIHDVPNSILNNPQSIWPISQIKKNYMQWEKTVKKYLLSIPGDVRIRRLTAKMHVYNLSLIVRSESRILLKSHADEIHRSESLKLYRKIRDYCYI